MAEQRLHLALRIARHVAILNDGAFPAPAELAQRMQESEPSLDTEVLPSLLAPAKPGFTYVVKTGTTENSILLAAESELGTLHTLFWEDGKSTYSRTRQPTYEQLVKSLGPSAYWTLGAGPDGLVDKSGNGYTLNPPARHHQRRRPGLPRGRRHHLHRLQRCLAGLPLQLRDETKPRGQPEPRGRGKQLVADRRRDAHPRLG